eukprot:CAMPEP_0170501750 /NCGR_PEP_ID=MMETSP0208-20121228/39301_1 /TAXON_ID=197538 /ORGANISM="Strombidium inclinatum, Strain S3" /LENGTH=87 /DNA_ID=CAMNT_0010780447 /DNA_START=157 /DNA_END=417 /DNA_ORIENTATION=-
METLHSNRADVDAKFADPSLLGTYLDNFNVGRFQGSTDSDWKNALVYSQTIEGIPFFYYGTELKYDGQWVPENREVMFCETTGSKSQ